MKTKDIDDLIATRVMGWKLIYKTLYLCDIPGHEYPCEDNFWYEGETYKCREGYFTPSANIAHAWQVVEKNIWNPRLQFGGLNLIRRADLKTNRWECKYYNGLRMFKTTADTAPLAICKAALKAVEGK